MGLFVTLHVTESLMLVPVLFIAGFITGSLTLLMFKAAKSLRSWVEAAK